jgi:hypothetical protein
MKRLPDVAMKECLKELRAACRLPIDPAAIETVDRWLRPNFESILGNPDGPKRWSDHGQRMRDNGRYLGTFADFFASHAEVATVGIKELTRAFDLVRAECTVRAERRPLSWEYCNPPPPPGGEEQQPAEDFLRALAKVVEPV